MAEQNETSGDSAKVNLKVAYSQGQFFAFEAKYLLIK